MVRSEQVISEYALARTQLTKRPPHLGGQRRAFYQLRENLEQSGDVTAPATTDAIWLVEEVVAVAQRLSAYWSIATVIA